MKNGYSEKDLDITLDDLVSHTQAILTGDDRIYFKLKLSTFPRYKLDGLIHFNGTFINEIWKFLDQIPSRQENTFTDYREPQKNGLPAPKSKVGEEVSKMRDAIEAIEFRPSAMAHHEPEKYKIQFEEWKKKCRKVEFEHLKKLHEMFPYNGFDNTLSDPRFSEFDIP